MKRIWTIGGRCLAIAGCAVLLLCSAADPTNGVRSEDAKPAAANRAPKEFADGYRAGDIAVATRTEELAAAHADAVWGERPGGASWYEMSRRFKGVFVLSASRQSRRVALTFDDVPDPRYTPLVLNALRKEGIRATFFIVGSRARKHPGLVKRIRREGHAIGNHSYDHPDFSKLSLARLQQQIRRTEAILSREVGFVPAIIRPPYGEIRGDQLMWTQKAGYTVVNWDVDSTDWKQLSAAAVYRNVTRATRPGSIILLHAGGGEGQNLYGTVRAIPRLAVWLRDHGYEPVTLPELLGISERKNG